MSNSLTKICVAAAAAGGLLDAEQASACHPSLKSTISGAMIHPALTTAAACAAAAVAADSGSSKLCVHKGKATCCPPPGRLAAANG